jgi:CheY-specific phosphatase CheX
LVAQQEADLDEMARIILQDSTLARRLVHAVDPKAESERDCGMVIVREALLRTGVRCILLLAMSALLAFALVRTFRTMLGLELKNLPLELEPPFFGNQLTCAICFSGKADGKVVLRLSPDGARRVAAAMLRTEPENITHDAEINDAIGELLNVITGNLNSNLCDAGLDCRLHTPSISRTKTFEIETVPGGGWERAAFHAPGILIFVDLTVNPWR